MIDEEKQQEMASEAVVNESMDSTELENSESVAAESGIGDNAGNPDGTGVESGVADFVEASETTGAGANEDLVAEYQSKIQSLEQELAETQAKNAQLEDRITQYLRLAADFDNFRKRTQKEKEDLEQQVKCATITELLPVVDNFERARSQIKPQTEQEMNIHKSYQGVYKQLVECLKRIGVSPMRSEGKEFDPSLHEAVMREATDQYDEGMVMEELVRGYLLGDRVLRHALVKVAAAPENSGSSDQPSDSES